MVDKNEGCVFPSQSIASRRVARKKGSELLVDREQLYAGFGIADIDASHSWCVALRDGAYVPCSAWFGGVKRDFAYLDTAGRYGVSLLSTSLSLCDTYQDDGNGQEHEWCVVSRGGEFMAALIGYDICRGDGCLGEIVRITDALSKEQMIAFIYRGSISPQNL